MESKVKLKDLTLKIGSGSTPRGGKETYLDYGEIKLIRSQNIYNHFFANTGLVYISDEQASKLKNVEVQEGDILINITGDSIARNMVVGSEYLPARVNQHVSIIRSDNKKIDPYYLSAILTSEQMQRRLMSLGAVGGTRAALTKKMLEDLEIPVLDMQVQLNIGKVLKTLNEKIITNEKIMDGLEQVAQTLFKRWFVDFEFPGENGEPYKSSGGEMVESELNEIPRGWNIETLGSIAEKVGNSINIEKLEKIIPYIGLEHMPRGSIALSSWETSEKITSNKTSFQKGDILFGKLRPYFKKVGFAPIDGVCSTDIVVFNSKSSHYYSFLMCVVSRDEFIDYCNATATGTRMPRTGWSQMMKYNIVIPQKEVAKQFNENIKSFYERINVLIHENNNLQSLRSVLLPKLLSGEIELPDETEVTEHVPIP